MPRTFDEPVIVTLPAVIDLTDAHEIHDLLSAAVATGAPVIRCRPVSHGLL